MIHPYHGIWLGNKKQGNHDRCDNLYEPPENYAVRTKPNAYCINTVYTCLIWNSWNYQIIKMQSRLMVTKGYSTCGPGAKWGWLWKGNMRHSRDGNVLYLHYTNFNTSVRILYYSFTRCSQRKKLGDGIWYFYYFVQLHVNL